MYIPRTFSLMVRSLAVLTVALNSCTERDFDDNSMRVRAALSGANERPTPVSTPASGIITGTYFNISNQLTFTLNWSALTEAPVAMHFHGPAGPDQTAPPVVGITDFPASPTASMTKTITLTDEQEQQLMSGQWYFNIHTPTYPPGEIRGQVLVSR